MFRSDRFIFFDARYNAAEKEILVEGAYRSDVTEPGKLEAECKDSIELVLSVLRMNVPNIDVLGSDEERAKLACAKVDSMFDSASNSNAHANVCHSIRVWFQVKSDDRKSRAICNRLVDEQETYVKSR